MKINNFQMSNVFYKNINKDYKIKNRIILSLINYFLISEFFQYDNV